MFLNILSIAGSDPSGGAGVQGDIKSFAALGAYGMGVITALTVQNTKIVARVSNVEPALVAAQIEAIFDDIAVDAVKIGMLGGAETVARVAALMKRYQPPHIILDPVMRAGSGAALSDEGTLEVMRRDLMPLIDIVTPNIPEAEILLGRKIGAEDMVGAAQELLKFGARAVYLKGGHAPKMAGAADVIRDIYADRGQCVVMEQPRLEALNNHGTGCALSSALAVYLAKGLSPLESARAAQEYVRQTLRNACDLKVGQGNGPVQHCVKK